MKIYYSRCTEKGGGSNLVSLHSQAENEFVAGLLPMVCSFTCLCDFISEISGILEC